MFLKTYESFNLMLGLWLAAHTESEGAVADTDQVTRVTSTQCQRECKHEEITVMDERPLEFKNTFVLFSV